MFEKTREILRTIAHNVLAVKPIYFCSHSVVTCGMNMFDRIKL